eukprot:TRINITY_DN7300_c0_g1_i1.p1 TRINITY_DN7300_c0_g1~~TRINITY_DN7300_c0_g1_i1.p1  ORF type:complete len:243 (+),score=46.11 TRINITY_DN7300_c0_g1_i1:76-729(+)
MDPRRLPAGEGASPPAGCTPPEFVGSPGEDWSNELTPEVSTVASTPSAFGTLQNSSTIDPAASAVSEQLPPPVAAPRPRRRGSCLDWLRDQADLLELGHSDGVTPGESVAELWDPERGALRLYPSPQVPGLVCSAESVALGSFTAAEFSRSHSRKVRLVIPELGLDVALPPTRPTLDLCLVELTNAFEAHGVAYCAEPKLGPLPDNVEAGCTLCSVQ